MDIAMTARHFELNDSLRQHVQSRFSRLDRYYGRTSRVEVTLTEEKRQ